MDSNDRERVQESADELQKMVSGMGGVLLPKRALPKSQIWAAGSGRAPWGWVRWRWQSTGTIFPLGEGKMVKKVLGCVIIIISQGSAG